MNVNSIVDRPDTLVARVGDRVSGALYRSANVVVYEYRNDYKTFTDTRKFPSAKETSSFVGDFERYMNGCRQRNVVPTSETFRSF